MGFPDCPMLHVCTVLDGAWAFLGSRTQACGIVSLVHCLGCSSFPGVRAATLERFCGGGVFTLPLPPHLLECPAWVEGSIAPAQGPSEGPLLASKVLLSPGTSAKALVPRA